MEKDGLTIVYLRRKGDTIEIIADSDASTWRIKSYIFKPITISLSTTLGFDFSRVIRVSNVGAITLTIPESKNNPLNVYKIYKASATPGNNITIQLSGVDTFDVGGTSLLLTTVGTAIVLTSGYDQNVWYTLF